MGDDVKTKINQEQYDMLVQCSETKDTSQWNKWREENPKTIIQLAGANFEKAFLKEVDFKGVDLRGANLQGADLQGANLRKANLKGTLLFESNLRDADLQGAFLWGADLNCVNLEGANCYKANLTKADFKGAKLTGILFDSNARLNEFAHPLSEAQMASAIFIDEQVDDKKWRDAPDNPENKWQDTPDKPENKLRDAPDNPTEVKPKTEQVYKTSKTKPVKIPDKFQDGEVIVRAILFDRENVQSGISILNYFGEILRHKYENKKAKLLIEQEGLNVRLAIETKNGDKQAIEKALEDYIAVVTERKPMSEFLKKPLAKLSLRLKLEMANLELKHTEELYSIKKTQSEKSSENCVERLYNLLSNNICIRWR